LQRSRERLVTAREEERRRLRGNLHDGLGPALSSPMLKLAAARLPKPVNVSSAKCSWLS
jgi:two-component system, NarL family, sensor kinase